MAQAVWNLHLGRPAVEVRIAVPGSQASESKLLLADTGAGPNDAPFELLLDEEDCLLFSKRTGDLVRLGGAYSGEYRCYFLDLEIPDLQFACAATAVGIPKPPRGFDGIAAFRFLNRFTYGNFGKSDQFGIELKSDTDHGLQDDTPG